MNLLETTKRAVERATGLARPTNPAGLVHRRKPQLFRFKDDGLVPNHPRWALIVYRGAVRLPAGLDGAAVFEDLFARNGWADSWRDGIYPYVHYHSRIHEVLGIARGCAIVQFGGPRGRKLRVKAGDVAILPAGTGHQCFEASDDFLVIGAYPARGVYDECTTIRERARAKKTIAKVPRPGKDPIYGKAGPLLRAWKVD
jgi:uncharacterized protein YjlB